MIKLEMTAADAEHVYAALNHVHREVFDKGRHPGQASRALESALKKLRAAGVQDR